MTTPNNAQPITINNQHFPSMTAAAKYFEIAPVTLRRKLERGIDPASDTPRSAVIAAAREMQSFTATALIQATKAKPGTVYAVIKQLNAADKIHMLPRHRNRGRVYAWGPQPQHKTGPKIAPNGLVSAAEALSGVDYSKFDVRAPKKIFVA